MPVILLAIIAFFSKDEPAGCGRAQRYRTIFVILSRRMFPCSFFPATWIRLHHRNAARKLQEVSPIPDMSSFHKPATVSMV